MPVLVLPVELTHAQARACLNTLSQGVQTAAGTGVVVDASALARFDSAALAVLLAMRRQCLALGQSFAVAHIPAGLADLATLYGIGELLGVKPAPSA